MHGYPHLLAGNKKLYSVDKSNTMLCSACLVVHVIVETFAMISAQKSGIPQFFMVREQITGCFYGYNDAHWGIGGFTFCTCGCTLRQQMLTNETKFHFANRHHVQSRDVNLKNGAGCFLTSCVGPQRSFNG